MAPFLAGPTRQQIDDILDHIQPAAKVGPSGNTALSYTRPSSSFRTFDGGGLRTAGAGLGHVIITTAVSSSSSLAAEAGDRRAHFPDR